MAREQILPWGLDDPPATGSTQYQSVVGQGEVALWTSTESDVRVVMPTAGTFRELALTGDASPGVGKSYTFKLRINGADSALTATISGTSTNAYGRGNVSVNAGDVLTMSCTPSGTPSAINFRGMFLFCPTDPGVCVVMGGSGDVALGLAAGYLAPHALANRSAGEDQVWMVVPDVRGIGFGTIGHIRVALDVAPGLGTSRTFEIYLNGAATGELVTISGTDTIGNADVSVGIGDGDTVSLYTYPTGSPAGSKAYYGMTISTAATGDYLIAGVSGGAMSTSTTTYEYNFASTGNAAWRTAKTERPNQGMSRHHILALGLKLTRAPNTGGGSGKAYELYFENPSAGGQFAYVLDANTYDLSPAMGWGLKRLSNINVRSLSYGGASVVDGSWVMQMRYVGG